MRPETMPYDDRLEIAVLECIMELGIQNVHLDEIARRMGWSRSKMFGEYRTWQALAETIHLRVMGAVEPQFRVAGGDRRFQFELWWANATSTLRTPMGRAFKALRGVAGAVKGLDLLQAQEVEELYALTTWLGAGRMAQAHAAWAAVLIASAWEEHAREAIEIREMVWAAVERRDAVRVADDELDFDRIEALDAPIWVP
jgi:hypothetical protein